MIHRVNRPIKDEHLGLASEEVRDILRAEVSLALEELDSAGNVDWRTLDLRIFRDSHTGAADVLERDSYLTVRASALTKEGQ